MPAHAPKFPTLSSANLPLFWAQALGWWALWAELRDAMLLEFGPWEYVDRTVNIGAVTGQHRASLVNMFAHRSMCYHGLNFKMKASPCSAHWAYQHETWAQEIAHPTPLHFLPERGVSFSLVPINSCRPSCMSNRLEYCKPALPHLIRAEILSLRATASCVMLRLWKCMTRNAMI